MLRTLKSSLVVVAAGLGLMLPAAANGATDADTVLRNGTVLTMDRGNPVKGAVAIRNGRIVYTGSSRGAGKFIGKKTRVINLKGKTAMPGLVDGHSHPLGGGDILDNCDLGNVEATIPELIDLISACDKADPATGSTDWLQVSNWSPVGVLPAGTVVTRQDLDAAFPDRPVYVQGSDFHNSWVNSRALELAGVTKDTPDPGDGEFDREEDGTPTGLLMDGAQWLVFAAIPPKKLSEIVDDGKRAVRAMNAMGITSTADSASDEISVKAWKAISKRGKLNVRVNSLPVIGNDMPVNAAANYFKGLAGRYESGRARIPGIKLFLDGVIEYPSQTAALLSPYLVQDGDKWVPGKSKGDLYHSQKNVNQLVTRFDRMKKLIHMHAIGDAAVREGLNGAAAARMVNRSASLKNISIGHLQLVAPSDYSRFGKLGVFATMQLQWAVSNFWTQEALHPFIGDERFNRLYPSGSLFRAGAPLSMGSDWPVDPLNPWLEIQSAKTRSSSNGDVLDASESIPMAAVLKAHTAGSATQLGLSKRVGSLKAGKDADIIVIDRNPLKAKPMTIEKTKVLRTIIGGKTVYRPSAKSAKLIAKASSLSSGEAGAH
ncbi:MAG: amidohydrolase [Solirubrobacterales bacterium]